MSPNLSAFLRVIRAGETGQGDSAYRTMFGGGLFDDFSDHPRQKVTRGTLTSTAAGAYQFLSKTWDECAKALNLPDFSPASQDAAAVFLIKRRGALEDVEAGRIQQAIVKCNREWASLPGSPYGQPTRTMDMALATYQRYGGTLEQSQATPEWRAPAGEADITPPEKPMAPFIAAGLSALIQNAPSLIRIFGDSPQAEKNAKAAETVAAIAQQVTSQPTVEGAVKAIESDPAVAAQYREAVHKSMTSGELLQIMVTAGEADDKSRGLALDRNLQLVSASGGRWLWLLGGIAALVIVMSYLMTAGVLFWKDSTFSDETKALLLGQVVIFGFVTILGFLYGSNISNKIDQRDKAQKGE